MKKSILFIAVFSLTLIFSSCKQDPEKLIIGDWTNTSTKIDKLDQVAQGVYDANIQYLQMQLNFYKSQVDTMQDTASVTIYNSVINDIEQQINNMNLDTIKANITKNYDLGVFTFNEDKSFVLSRDEDSLLGSWSISNDSLTIVLQDKPIPLKIKELTKNSLSIIQENNIDTLNFEIEYTFSKN